jgi:hypothetical protein
MRLYLSVVMVSVCAWQQSSAQPEPPERIATEQEITGDWRLVPLPEALQPKALQINPWPSACQWFSYGSGGILKSIDHAAAPCETLSARQLDEALTHVAPVVSWKYESSPAHNRALVIVTRSDLKGYAEYWEPRVVTAPYAKEGAEFKQGDLVLYLVDLQAHRMTWIRHLEKLK